MPGAGTTGEIMHSAIYEGRVRHRRFVPVHHEFDYRLFLMYLDLAELGEVFQERWFWRIDRCAPMQFLRADHLGDVAVPLDVCVRDLVESHGRPRPKGPIRLLTG